MMSLFVIKTENVNAVTEGMIAFLWSSDLSPIPDGWECISCNPTDPFYERYPRISTVYGLQGGSFLHNHTISIVTSTPSSATIFNKPGAANSWNAGANLHTHNSADVGFSKIVFPQNISIFNTTYMRMIRYKTGIPSSLPLAVCGFFNDSLNELSHNPGAFLLSYTFNGTLLMGNKTGVISVPSISHSHWGINITTGFVNSGLALDTGTYQNTSYDTHTHNVNNANFSEVDYTLEAPPFLNLPLICANNPMAGVPIPNGFIAMFNTTVTNSSFTMLNASTQLNRYIMLNYSANSFNTTGGFFNHTHSDSKGYVSTNGTTATPRILQIGGQGGAKNDHYHTINFSTNPANNTPPYTTVILAMYTPENVPVSQPSLPTKVGCFIISKVDELFNVGRPEECDQTYDLE